MDVDKSWVLDVRETVVGGFKVRESPHRWTLLLFYYYKETVCTDVSF